MICTDLYAGLGGNSAGAKNAGCDVIWAANHNPLAIQFHQMNHPDTAHFCQDMQQADWSMVPSHDLSLSSPCCQGHSKASGRQGPHHYSSRSTAWAVLSNAEFHRPYCVFVENVKSLMQWPLYPAWKSAFETLGYSIQELILDAAHLGMPQNRNRLYLLMTQSRSPLSIYFEQRPLTTFRDIFDDEETRWSPIYKKGRAQKTIERIENGRKRFGDFFVYPYYSNGSGLTGRTVDRPIGTVTTKDRWAVVQGDQVRMLNVKEYRRAMGFSQSTKLPTKKEDAVLLLGNATCPPVVEQIISEIKAVA